MLRVARALNTPLFTAPKQLCKLLPIRRPLQLRLSPTIALPEVFNSVNAMKVTQWGIIDDLVDVETLLVEQALNILYEATISISPGPSIFIPTKLLILFNPCVESGFFTRVIVCFQTRDYIVYKTNSSHSLPSILILSQVLLRGYVTA